MMMRRTAWISPPQRLAIRRVGELLLRHGTAQLTHHWPPYSRLFLPGGSAANWVLNWETRELVHIAHHLGVRVVRPRWRRYIQQQAVFYNNRYQLLMHDAEMNQPHRLGLAYFHGLPGTPEEPLFDDMYQRLCQFHHRITRIQVSHSDMRDVVLNTGIEPEKVFLIPIGIQPAFFSAQTHESRQRIRAQLGIPQTAVVVGSFQKDGNGWGEGLEPKWVKGPDIFLRTIEHLQPRIPELFVLLSGPARGYVKMGLERLGIPYQHHFVRHYPDIGKLYHALDVYVVASRQEGGPKAVLESMASGVPLVTTRVGQAMDIVQHEHNGWMVDVEDAEGLAYWAEYCLYHSAERAHVVDAGRQTAAANTYDAQIPLWRNFMRGFVQLPGV
jgi:glycosyltransferase involved in cell wall biosynthesis